MSLLDQLREKPWETAAGTVDERYGTRSVDLATPHVGLRVFLGVATVVFSLFIIMYAGRMAYADWRPLPEPWILWLNTAMLILSSVGLHWAYLGARREQPERIRAGLAVGGAFALAFLVGQLYASQQLVAQGYYAASNPANGFFYLLTGVHAAHLFGGLVAWGRTILKLWQGVEVGDIRMSVEMCAIYWHFLLVVWLVLFGLLLFT